MVWRRLPSYFPNLPLKLIPLTEAQQTAYEKTGFLRRLAFRTLPSVNKVPPAGASCSASARRRGRRLLWQWWWQWCFCSCWVSVFVGQGGGGVTRPC